MTDRLKIEHRSDTTVGVELVAPRGEIDISNVEDLDQRLRSALARRPRQLLVDLSGVPYMDSAGITTLLHARQAIDRTGGELVLVGGSPFIRRLFRMIGVGKLFPHRDTVAEALVASTKAPAEATILESAGSETSPEECEELLPA
jgi:stage II sporulation protein AA (anti-sigma F factor antagonist)